uniref:Uncharacterized protein n=1 Tax=Nelumbo nucifera TaxID=4432 RepID=A0A822YDU0_NELNU|nr:TPA_asm: hypothetical protein HUJ06_011175 [Nelumbo nucifera]
MPRSWKSSLPQGALQTGQATTPAYRPALPATTPTVSKMGSCFSSESSNSPVSPTIKVISADGKLHDYISPVTVELKPMAVGNSSSRRKSLLQVELKPKHVKPSSEIWDCFFLSLCALSTGCLSSVVGRERLVVDGAGDFPPAALAKPEPPPLQHLRSWSLCHVLQS